MSDKRKRFQAPKHRANSSIGPLTMGELREKVIYDRLNREEAIAQVFLDALHQQREAEMPITAEIIPVDFKNRKRR